MDVINDALHRFRFTSMGIRFTHKNLQYYIDLLEKLKKAKEVISKNNVIHYKGQIFKMRTDEEIIDDLNLLNRKIAETEEEITARMIVEEEIITYGMLVELRKNENK